MNRKAVLQRILAKARAELNEIIESREIAAANNKIIGNCYRFSNSYGSGDRWWLYGKVIAVEGGDITMFKFQKTAHGQIEIEARYMEYARITSGWEQIAEAKFQKAWRAIANEIAGFAP